MGQEILPTYFVKYQQISKKVWGETVGGRLHPPPPAQHALAYVV